MDRNIVENEICSAIAQENDEGRLRRFFAEIFTKSELETLIKRWQILKLLNNGETQRNIAQELKVSLCKVTRGSQILKNKNSVIAEYLKKGQK